MSLQPVAGIKWLHVLLGCKKHHRNYDTELLSTQEQGLTCAQSTNHISLDEKKQASWGLHTIASPTSALNPAAELYHVIANPIQMLQIISPFPAPVTNALFPAKL